MRFTLVFTVFLCLAFLAFSAEESVSEENKPSIWEDFVYTELYSVEEPGNEWNWTSVSDGVGLNLERDTVNIRHRNKEDEWEKSSFQHDVSGLEFLGFRDSTVYCYAPKMKDSGLRYAESIRVLGISLSGERVCDVEFSDFPSYEEGDGPYPNSSDIDKYHYHFDCQVVLSSNGRELLLLQEASFFDLQRGTFANWGVSIETYLNLPDLSCTSKSVRSQQLTGILPSNDTITPDCRVLFTRDNPFDIISRYHGIETIVRAASNIDDFEITNSENCHPIIKTAAADIILVYLPPTMLEDHENVVVIVPKGDFEKAKAISVPLYPAVVFSVGSYILHMAAADEEYPTLFSVHDSLGIEINFSTGTVKRYPLPYFRIWKKGHSQYVVKYRSDRYALYNNISEYDLRQPLMPSQATATESFRYPSPDLMCHGTNMYFTNDSSTELNVLDLSRNKARVILRLMDSKFIQRFAYDSTNGNIAVLTSDNVLSYYTYEHERGLSLKWKHEAFLDNDGWSCRSDSGLSAVDGQVTSAWTEPVRTGKAVLHTIVAANDSKHSYQFAVDEEPNGMNSYPGLIQIRGFNLEKRRVDAAYVGSTGKPVKHPLPTYNNGSRILGFTVANGELEFVSSHVDSDEVKRTQIATIEQPRERIVASKKATAVMGNMFCSVMYLDKEKGCYLAYSTLDSQRSGLIKLHQSPRFLYMTSADTACCAFDDKVVKYQLK